MMVCAVSEHPFDRLEIPDRKAMPVDEQRLMLTNPTDYFDENNTYLRDARTSQVETPKEHQDISLFSERCVGDPRITNLASFRSERNFLELPAGSFRKVSKLSEGINGDIFLFDLDRQGAVESVVVKMLRNDSLDKLSGTETDERAIHMGNSRRTLPPAEDALAEIGILSFLSKQDDLPSSLLRMHDIFVDGDFTWLAMEYAEGGELFQVAASGSATEMQVRRYMSELLQAVAYLHCHSIAHRDISLENILLKNGSVKLMDFGMAVCSHSSSGIPLRYYRAVGKEFFRAPECYIPVAEQLYLTVPPRGKGGDIVLSPVVWEGANYLCELRLPAHAVPGKRCKADVWGYAPTPADIWAVGICLFILSFQCPPWSFATLHDPAFSYVHAVGEGSLQTMLTKWGKSVSSQETIQLLGNLLRPDPSCRPSAQQCLADAWFSLADDIA
jgi:serine/threonine protein kinase